MWDFNFERANNLDHSRWTGSVWPLSISLCVVPAHHSLISALEFNRSLNGLRRFVHAHCCRSALTIRSERSARRRDQFAATCSFRTLLAAGKPRRISNLYVPPSL